MLGGFATGHSQWRLELVWERVHDGKHRHDRQPDAAQPRRARGHQLEAEPPAAPVEFPARRGHGFIVVYLAGEGSWRLYLPTLVRDNQSQSRRYGHGSGWVNSPVTSLPRRCSKPCRTPPQSSGLAAKGGNEDLWRNNPGRAIRIGGRHPTPETSMTFWGIPLLGTARCSAAQGRCSVGGPSSGPSRSELPCAPSPKICPPCFSSDFIPVILARRDDTLYSRRSARPHDPSNDAFFSPAWRDLAQMAPSHLEDRYRSNHSCLSSSHG